MGIYLEINPIQMMPNMESFYAIVGKVFTIVATTSVVGIVGCLILYWSALLCRWLVMKSMEYFECLVLWDQLKKTHRLFFAWAVSEMDAGRRIYGSDGKELTSEELCDAFNTWDKDNVYRWTTAVNKAYGTFYLRLHN